MCNNSHCYSTVLTQASVEIDAIKGSRFIGCIAPVSSDEQAHHLVREIQAEYSDARHWCWAYQLLEQHRTRCNDDGEPRGSAGKPILAPLIGRELFNCMVVVVRYFGGVKLGVGGLVRAYSQASNMVIAEASIITVTPKITIQLCYGYNDTARVAAALAELGLDEYEPAYTGNVCSYIRVLPHDVDMICTQLTNHTGGKIKLVVDAAG